LLGPLADAGLKSFIGGVVGGVMGSGSCATEGALDSFSSVVAEGGAGAASSAAVSVGESDEDVVGVMFDIEIC
jgi:hypothetical protein